jgi:pimeloyl-ACP methyl ester carboxylesterase
VRDLTEGHRMTEISLARHRSRLQYLATPGGRIAHLDTGPRDGRPVVLVHGMPTSSYLYRRVAERLAQAGVRAIAPDMLGFGASDKPADARQYELAHQADRLALLLDHLGLPAATFVVHDLGGPWVFELADRHPERLTGLVVLNTSAYAELMTPPREARLVGGPLGPALAALMGSRAGRPMIRKFFADFTHRGRTLDRAVTTAHWTPLHEGGTRAFRLFARDLDATMAQFARHAAALRRLGVPAAVVWGVEDPVLRAETIVPRFVADLRIAPQDVHLLDRASHFLQEDRPDDIAEVVADLVDRARTTGTAPRDTWPSAG